MCKRFAYLFCKLIIIFIFPITKSTKGPFLWDLNESPSPETSNQLPLLQQDSISVTSQPNDPQKNGENESTDSQPVMKRRKRNPNWGKNIEKNFIKNLSGSYCIIHRPECEHWASLDKHQRNLESKKFYKVNMDESGKKRDRKQARIRYANMTKEQRRKMNERTLRNYHLRMSKMTPKQLSEFREKKAKQFRERHLDRNKSAFQFDLNRTPPTSPSRIDHSNQFIDHDSGLCIVHRPECNHWKVLSDKERKSQSRKASYLAKTFEEKEEIREKRRKRYNSMNKEKKEIYKNNQKLKRNKKLKLMTKEQKIQKNYKWKIYMRKYRKNGPLIKMKENY